jgi:hypothetical protein
LLPTFRADDASLGGTVPAQMSGRQKLLQEVTPKILTPLKFIGRLLFPSFHYSFHSFFFPFL